MGVDRRLIISYDGTAPSVFVLGESARGLCEIIWLVDLAEPGMTKTVRLLRRIGKVVDIAGLSRQETVQAIALLEPTGILALNDHRMVLLAEIAADIGLDFHSPTVAERLSDKRFQRQALHDAGLHVPPSWEIEDYMDHDRAELVAATISFPAVLKPRRGDGSRNVRYLHDAAELVRIMTAPDDLQPEADGWMLEGYLESADRPVSRYADVVSVESFVEGGSIHHLAVTGRFPFAVPFRETGSVLPSDVSTADAEAAKAVATAALGALDVRHGCHHTELKFTPDGPCVIEVNGRVGGGIPELLVLAGGNIKLIRFAMELALGIPSVIELPLTFSRVGYRLIVPPPVSARRIVAMEGHDRLMGLPGVDAVTLNRLPGDAVDWRLGLGEFIYSVYGWAQDHDDVEAMCEVIGRTVTIAYDGSS